MPGQLAVIFDVDGVLVDSYAAHFDSWRALFREHGADLAERDFARTFGKTSAAVLDELWPERGLSPQQIEALDAQKEAHYREALARHFSAVDGAHELVVALGADGMALAVGSSGPPENIGLVLDALGGPDTFGAVVTGRDVTRGKPDPQVFALAAERLGVPAGRCCVIEDAAVGIEAARAAGMASVGFVGTGRTAEELAAADLVVHSLRELSPPRIRRLIEGRRAGSG